MADLPSAAAQARTMNKCPALVYRCKVCRYVESDPILMKNVIEIMNELKNELKDVKNEVQVLKNELFKSNANNETPLSWSSMTKRFRENTSKSVVVVNSKDVNVKTAELKKLLKEKLKDENVEKVNTIPTSKNNGIIVVCENDMEKEKVRKAVEKNVDECVVTEPKKKNPRIKILNVELESDEEKNSDAIIEQIKRRNENIFGDFSIFQKFEHVVTVPRKNKGKRVQNKYDIICSTDPNTFKKIMEAKKIKFGFQQCNVVDGTYVPRCFRCYGFFHKAGDCDICDENENICIKWGGRNHKKAKCTAEVSCNNCTEYNKKNKNAKLDVKHSIIDFECPCYQKAFKSHFR
ncbi:unnamed protein product [Chironomus riparius]|uniref:Uncharacterized protein n=1 Tax=Chironomus riparius TaxID=315576 RepID=A0A9N9S855_9DIPT|nr:unnamed protein product [Chironomus riparius]